MKKLLVFLSTCLLIGGVTTNVYASPYPDGGIVVNPTEDWEIGDYASFIMDDVGTPEIYDDITIASYRYCGHWISNENAMFWREQYLAWCSNNGIDPATEPLTVVDGAGNFWTE